MPEIDDKRLGLVLDECGGQIDLLRRALSKCGESIGPCRPCSVCGEEHHWIESTPEETTEQGEWGTDHPLIIAAEPAFYVCKHCDAWRLFFVEDDDGE